jgi:hypothetical protein
MTRRLALGLLLVATIVGGCGGAAHHAAPPPTLPAAAVPYLPSAVKPLTARGLAREAQAPALTAQLSSWGYMAGSDRYFQGESRQLQVVDSRTLQFKAGDGARAFVAFVGAHLAAYLGSSPRVHGFASRGRRGILAIAQECQCHLANPAYLGVVSDGRTVTWLEINGPAATPRRLSVLIAAAP